MERKTTQRIIGMLVVIALVIILLPLLFGRNDMTTEAAATIKAPLPDEQQMAVNSSDTMATDSTDTQKNSVDISSDVAAAVNNGITPPQRTGNIQVADTTSTPQVAAPLQEPQTQDTAAPKATDQAQVDTDAQLKDLTVSANDQTQPTSNVITPALPTQEIKKDEAPKIEKKELHPTKKVVQNTEKHSKPKLITSLKSPVWVVQMGSFKDKANAQRLADKLRASGYKAFTHQFKSAKTGNLSTRVYIGPEVKQASAQKLSNNVMQQLNLQGYVISYNPLEL